MPKYRNLISFIYKFGLHIKDKTYTIKYYNTPYKSSLQEEDDLLVMLTGTDSHNNMLPHYKCVPWESWEDGFYKIEVECNFVRQIHTKKRVYDQIFNLKKVEKTDESMGVSDMVS